MSGGFTKIDLSGLPRPAVVEELDYEKIRQEIIDELVERDPEYTAIVESDPGIKLIEAFAYREMLVRQRVNDAARAVMLAFGQGTDLDHLAALYGVRRMKDEDDARLLRRVQLAPEAFSVAGPIGAYIFHALSADEHIHDASVYVPEPGSVIVTVMMKGEEPVPDSAMLAKVAKALDGETVRPLTDDLAVLPVDLVDVEIQLALSLFPGPDEVLVIEEVNAALDRLIDRTGRLGFDLRRSAIYAAAHVSGVHGVEILKPAHDVDLTVRQAYRVVDRSITVTGRDS